MKLCVCLDCGQVDEFRESLKYRCSRCQSVSWHLVLQGSFSKDPSSEYSEPIGFVKGD